MLDLNEALSEIGSIREQMARSSRFLGYGPRTHALTGLLALGVAACQVLWPAPPPYRVALYFALWIATALFALVMTGTETVVRSRRLHALLSLQMMHCAVEQFLPAIVAGGLLSVVLWRVAPESTWMLPGLWQVLFSLGVFASVRFLPRATFWVGIWYLFAGLACLVLCRGERALSPWEMGIPFGIGQLLVAGVLQLGRGESDESA